jgi:carboxymethylenebutenolidase
MKAWFCMGVVLLGVMAAEAQEKAPEVFKGEKIFLRDFGGDEVAYLSIPDLPPALGVVVAPDGHGIDGRVKRLCDALARQGYLALAVDLTNGRTTDDPEAAALAQKGIDIQVAERALQAGLGFYEKSPRFRMERIALVTLGASDAIGARVARSKRGRNIIALSMIDSPGGLDALEIRGRLQRLVSPPGAVSEPAVHVAALHAFWNSEQTKKNWFQRFVE